MWLRIVGEEERGGVGGGGRGRGVGEDGRVVVKLILGDNEQFVTISVMIL